MSFFLVVFLIPASACLTVWTRVFPSPLWSSIVPFIRKDRRSDQISGNMQGVKATVNGQHLKSRPSRRSQVAVYFICLNDSYCYSSNSNWATLPHRSSVEKGFRRHLVHVPPENDHRIQIFRTSKNLKKRSKKSCIPVWVLLDPCSVRKPSLTDLLDQRCAVQILKGFQSRFCSI